MEQTTLQITLGQLGAMSEGDRPTSSLSQASSTATISSVSMGAKRNTARTVKKVHTFGKRANSIKRDPNSPVIMRGWLYKQDSSGLKLWKRRWFVLSNYCLFYYRDSREEKVLGSIPLPSYEIRTAFSKEKKNRRFVFKAEHSGMRTYYFSAETQLDMNSWIKAMNQAATAECDCGNYTRGLQSQNVSTHTSFEDVREVPDDYAKSTESLEIAHLSEKQEDEASLSESLHQQDSQKGSPLPRRISLSSSVNGIYYHERIEQPDLSSLSSQTYGCPSPISCTKFISGPRSPAPPPSESPPPSSPSRTPQTSPMLSIRSSRSYSLPLTPAESPRIPEAHLSPNHVHRKPPRTAAAQASSCEDLSSRASPRTLVVRPNTPMGRVDIAPSETPPSNPYGILAPGTRGRSLTPADRYDVHPSSEEPYGRRFARSPHSIRARPLGEDSFMGTLGRPQQNRFPDRGYISPSTGPTRALVMNRLHGRLITPHSASSSYLHLPPLPPTPNRSTPGKRTSLGNMNRTPVRERNIHPGSGQRFETNTDVLLTKLCGQDKLLRGFEDEIGQLQAEKERLEKSLEMTRLRLEECKGQDATMEKIGFQQRQLQDELVQIRARLCDLALDSERAWEDYAALESELQMLKGSLEHIRSVGHPQDQTAAQQDLWRIHDILSGLRCSTVNYHNLENRRSDVSSTIIPALDSHLGANHNPQMPSNGTEKESETAIPPKSNPTYHEFTSSHVLVTGDSARVVRQSENKQQDAFSGRDLPRSPPASSKEQRENLSRCLEEIRWSPNSVSEKGHAMRGTDAACLGYGSRVNPLSKDVEPNIAKVAPSEATAPRSGRMSAQEQLIRMQRNQEAKRKAEAAQSNPPGPCRESLKRGSSRPLPNSPPEPSPKESVQNGGLKPSRCSPTPEWERQRVIQLSYALAAEASQQREKRIAGRTSSHSSLDDISASHDNLSHQHLPSNATSKDSDSRNKKSEHDQKAPRNLSCSASSSPANQARSSPQTANRISYTSEAFNRSFPHAEEDNHLSSKPKTPQLTPRLLDSNNEKPSLIHIPRQGSPLPQSANGNLSFSRGSPPPWDCEGWASEQNLVGSQGPAHGRRIRSKGKPKSPQVARYLGDIARPVKVTLAKSSF
ncbi:pleckstrin homology domain-containing family A member 4 isoform X1 [Anolis carolinensis]|uniref:pleckstrin homology domain-containing family A member 4 isoform X1 n=2 Tax=Anolis carolinensis TaxID=28377 RepID=UPI002F2B5603